jgi:hypothetical protein
MQGNKTDEINRRQKNWQENPDANHRLGSDDVRVHYYSSIFLSSQLIIVSRLSLIFPIEQ